VCKVYTNRESNDRSILITMNFEKTNVLMFSTFSAQYGFDYNEILTSELYESQEVSIDFEKWQYFDHQKSVLTTKTVHILKKSDI